MVHMEDPQGKAVRYFAAAVSETGVPSVSLATTSLDYAPTLPEGYAQIRQLQAGTCASEFFYFGRRSPDLPSRFEADLADARKQEYYLSRNREAGIAESEESLSRFKELMLLSMFHEGFCRIEESNPRTNAPTVPILQFVPERDSTQVRFVKRIVPLTLEENLEVGRLAVRNPAYVCDAHSSAGNLNPITGWPYQCDRSTDNHHAAKGTVGHTEFIGTAVSGPIRVPLHALTPVPQRLQSFIEEDLRARGRLLTLIEPLGCVFDAFGTMLHVGEIPSSVLIFGDGSSALNTVAFLRVHSPEAKIKELFEDVLKAHELGVVYGDRWPDNILIDPNLGVVHIDFDLKLGEFGKELELAQLILYTIALGTDGNGGTESRFLEILPGLISKAHVPYETDKVLHYLFTKIRMAPHYDHLLPVAESLAKRLGWSS